MMNRLHFWLEHLQRCGAAVLAQAIEALPAVWQKSAALSDSEAMLLDRLTRLEQSILPAAFASFPEEIGPRSFTSGGEDRRQPGAGMCEFKGCRAECGSNPMPATAEAREIEADLKDAIEKGQIAVHYQPEFEVRSLRLVRFEALARWRHPVKGMIPPDKFIPVAERTGHIRKLGRYVMEQACLQAAALERAQGKGIQIAVNVSGIQLTSEGFVEEVKAVLRTTGLNPDLLQIELTESVLMTGTCRAVAAIERLSQMGVSIAVDDFGSGYSGFGYLNKLPVTAIKLDQSFAGGLGRFDKTEAMMESLITLARNLGINLIVEGVETAEQLETISGLGGREVQGYLLGTPMPAPIDLAASCSLVPAGKFPQLPFDDAPALPYVSELPKPSAAWSRESVFAATSSPGWAPSVSGS